MWNGKLFIWSLLVVGVLVSIYIWKWRDKAGLAPTASTLERVQAYYEEMMDMGIAEESFVLFLRAFKAEQELEVWVSQAENGVFQHLHTYPICKSSGDLGPKRKEGDLQVPEGFYHIDRMNPNSSYHLSMGLNYPNASDKIRGDQDQPGSDIFIHGDCVTVGCLPMTDSKIEELYMMVTQAQKNGQQEVPVHIFPARLSSPAFQEEFVASPHQLFWQELLPIYQYFEAHRKLPAIQIGTDGDYQL